MPTRVERRTGRQTPQATSTLRESRLDPDLWAAGNQLDILPPGKAQGEVVVRGTRDRDPCPRVFLTLASGPLGSLKAQGASGNEKMWDTAYRIRTARREPQAFW